MRTSVCVCVLLGLALPQLALADKHKGGGNKGGGGKHAAGGAANAARGGGAAGQRHIGGGGRAPGIHQGGGGLHNGAGGHGQRGLNAHGGGGRHGLNAHKGGQHGLNARHTGGLKAHRAGKLSTRHVVNHRFVGRHRFAGHWRSGLRWRNHHALYAGYRRAWHDHWWWRSHYNRVVFVGGGYWGGHWYWDGGYWFPAWGYDPGYTGYVYDGPIFAYGNLPPDQVVVSVQEALQDEGYYSGDLDGQLGSGTRDALASYQRDHQLDITAAIDEPTVQSLGLTTEEA